jgi:hypothetical protein
MKRRKLTPATIPTVFGLDVTSSTISIAKITSEMDRPGCRVVLSPSPSRSSHSVATSLHRLNSTTDEVLDVVLRDGVRPHLVVMGKQSWGLIGSDPSAARRIGQWWDIAQALHRFKVPTAEVALASAAVWAMGSAPKLSLEGLQVIRDHLISQWDGLDEAMNSTNGTYRPSAVLFAAFGAMTIGLPTVYAPTEERVRALTMRRNYKTDDPKTARQKLTPGWVQNMTTQFPIAVRPVPSTPSEWHMRSAKLGVAQPEPKAAAEDDEVA